MLWNSCLQGIVAKLKHKCVWSLYTIYSLHQSRYKVTVGNWLVHPVFILFSHFILSIWQRWGASCYLGQHRVPFETLCAGLGFQQAKQCISHFYCTAKLRSACPAWHCHQWCLKVPLVPIQNLGLVFQQESACVVLETAWQLLALPLLRVLHNRYFCRRLVARE